MYFWPTANLNHIIFSAFNLWLIGIMYISVLILGCVLFRPAFASVLLVLVATLLLSLISIPKQIAPYTPNFLMSKYRLDFRESGNARIYYSNYYNSSYFYSMFTSGCYFI